jgi:Recombinase/Recombinase zinc beta ribbon domain/Resolvase, N terminal domain
VKEGKSSGIIVADLKRLSRDTEHGKRLMRELEEAGGRFYSPEAPDDITTPEEDFHVGLLFMLGELERKQKRAGFERAKERAIRLGIPVATRPAVGYRQRPDRRLERDPATAPVVRELFERRAAGEGPTALGRFLESHGVKTSQGSAGWSKAAVQSVIASRVYLGELSYGKDRRYVNPAAHEPIVDLATWEAAQHPNGRRLQAPRGEGNFLLTGLMRCQACGHVMQATTTSRGKRIYRCVRRHAGGECPQPARVYADAIEPEAERAFWAVTEDLSATPLDDDGDHLRELEAQLAIAERRLAHAMTPEVQDAAGEGWAPMLRERRAERDAAAEALGHARARLRTGEDHPDVESLRALWPALSPSERRELLGARFDAFALRREGKKVTLAAFPAGTAPADLSRRGFRRNPGLHPLDIPATARVTTL